jgi:hypothetical protein
LISFSAFSLTAKSCEKTYRKEDTFRRWLNGKRFPKREALAKFVVGLGLDIVTAKELFALHSSPLDPTNNRLDYIIALAIRDKDDIGQFAEDVEKYCDLSIL